MRLISIQLNNFQVHEDTLVEFSPTITTIKGPTDAGKSAIIRALRWLCLNDFAGDEFVRDGAKKAIVTLRFKTNGDKTEVRRLRGRHNTYELEGEEFKAFGKGGVPDKIAKLLNVTEINFQDQHDSPFWFNETAPEVSRRLNAIVDLAVIDTTLANIAAAVRNAQSTKQFATDRLEAAKKELEELKGQEGRIKQFKQVRDANEKKLKAAKDRDNLEELISDICANRDKAEKLKEQADQGSKVVEVAREALTSRRKETHLRELIEDIQKQQKRAVAPPNFEPVQSAFEKWQQAQRQLKGLEVLIRGINNATVLRDGWTKDAKLAEEKLHKAARGQVCPTCGRSL